MSIRCWRAWAAKAIALLNTGDPREILTRLKAERESTYAQAPIHITSGNQPHQATVVAILKAIEACL